MVDHRELFDEVCRAVERAGFGLAAPGEAGVHVGHRPQGVVVSWRPGGVPVRRPVAQTSLLVAVLERAGHVVSCRGADLLITASVPVGCAQA